jgi:hypothetical protein
MGIIYKNTKNFFFLFIGHAKEFHLLLWTLFVSGSLSRICLAACFPCNRNALAKNNEAVHKGAEWKKAFFLKTNKSE